MIGVIFKKIMRGLEFKLRLHFGTAQAVIKTEDLCLILILSQNRIIIRHH